LKIDQIPLPRWIVTIGVELITVEAKVIREAESPIAACDLCRPEP